MGFLTLRWSPKSFLGLRTQRGSDCVLLWVFPRVESDLRTWLLVVYLGEGLAVEPREWAGGKAGLGMHA